MSSIAAKELWQARLNNTILPRDFEGYPTREIDAYAIQKIMIAESGSTVIGWKIGATVDALMDVLGVDKPFIGPLFEEFLHADGAAIPVFAGQGLEVEFTIRLKDDLPHRATPYTTGEVEAAIGALIPSFEIIGFRFDGEPAGGGLRLIADGGANVGCILGPELNEWDADALPDHAVTLKVNGEEVARGMPSDLTWAHVFDAVGWLAGQPSMADRGLRAGDLIMTGTMTGMTPLKPGDQAEADFGSMGRINASFT